MTRKAPTGSSPRGAEAELVRAEAAAGEAGVRLREARVEVARHSRALAHARDQLAASGVDNEMRRGRLRPLQRALEDAEARADDAYAELAVRTDAAAEIRRQVEAERTRIAEPDYRRRYQLAVDAFAAALASYQEAEAYARQLEDTCPLPHQRLGDDGLLWAVESLLDEAADAGYSVKRTRDGRVVVV